jgi:hypothetical protein
VSECERASLSANVSECLSVSVSESARATK